MSVFVDGTRVSLDEILSDKTIQRFLHTLLMEVLFLTGGQVGASLRAAKPAGLSVHRFDRRVRYLLDQLVEAEHVGSAAVDRLPPATIGTEPIFTWHLGSPLPTDAEALGYAAASARRVPPLDSHTRTKLYFAREKLCPFLRSLGYRLPIGTLVPASETEGPVAEQSPALEPREAAGIAGQIEARARETGTLPTTVMVPVGPGGQSIPYRYVPHPGREAKFRKVLEWHLAVENRAAPSPHELAGTHLTALANLNQFRLSAKYRDAFETGEWEFSAHGNLTFGFTEGSFGPAGGARWDLYFLRPCHFHQIILQLEEYREKHVGSSLGCWWM
jgi:hypothetical protein